MPDAGCPAPGNMGGRVGHRVGRPAVLDERRDRDSRWPTCRTAPLVCRLVSERGDAVNRDSSGTRMTGARELNRRLGIKARYFGQAGGGAAVLTTTIERLCRTLVPGAGSGDARAILAELDREEGSRVLDPVVVATAGRSLKIVLRLPAAARILRWQVLTENGERHGGDARAAGLPTIFDGTSRRPGQVLHLDLDLPPGYHRLSL